MAPSIRQRFFNVLYFSCSFAQAIHGPTGDTVALKIIKIEEDDTLEAMVDEVRIMKMCNHPNIVKFYGAWKTQDELFVRTLHWGMSLTREDRNGALWRRIRAGSLSGYTLCCFCFRVSFIICTQVLKKPLSESQIALLARDTLLALEYLHDVLNVIHRDIKAANLLLTDDGKLKLSTCLGIAILCLHLQADFGVSAIRKSRTERRTSIIGTPYWYAPALSRP